MQDMSRTGPAQCLVPSGGISMSESTCVFWPLVNSFSELRVLFWAAAAQQF